MNDNFPEIDIALQIWRNWDASYTPLVATLGAVIILAYLYRKALS